MNPAISRETSYPSVPSVVSVNSSVVPDPHPDHPEHPEDPLVAFAKADAMRTPVARSTAQRPTSMTVSAPSDPLVRSADDSAHAHEHPETDEDDSESDEEFLVMSKTKSRSANTPKMSGRSGSTNTVKKQISKDLVLPEAGLGSSPRGRPPPQEE